MSHDRSTLSIAALRPEDLAAALAIQNAAYPPFLVEGAEAFRSRIGLAASYCLGARRGGQLLGYLLAHGWQRDAPPAVGAVLADGGPSEVLFIHDLAVSPAGRGLRVGEALITRALALAAQDGLRSAQLIAVEGAADYWRRQGFGEAAASAEMAAKIRAYGADARWMTREIGV